MDALLGTAILDPVRCWRGTPTLELSVERSTIHAEQPGGRCLVPVKGLQHPHDVTALDLVHRNDREGVTALERDSRRREIANTLGQIFDPDVIELRKSKSALDAILELANVAGPRICRQPFRRRALEADDTGSASRLASLHEGLSEEQYVVVPLPQRRHMDVDHVDPVEEVFPETTLLHLFFEIAVRRRHDSRVEWDFGVTTNRAHASLLQ